MSYDSYQPASSYMCAWCRYRQAAHWHHIKFRSEAKALIHDPNNQVPICTVCHDAAHGRKTTENTFNCSKCWLLNRCEAGQRLYGKRIQ